MIFLFDVQFSVLPSAHAEVQVKSISNIGFLPSFITSDIQIFFLSS